MLAIRKILFISALSVLLFSCKSSYQVVHVNKDAVPTAKCGFYYALPKTFIKVSITVNQQDNFKGPYCDYAKKYFGLNNIITQNSTTYQISDIKVDTYSEPDSSQFYFVESNDSRLTVKLSNLGVIEAVNPGRQQSKTIEKRIMIDSSYATPKNEFPELFKLFTDMNLYEKTDTIYERVKGDTSYVFEKKLKTFMVEKPTEQKVKETVDLIAKLKENRFNLLNGDIEVNDKNISFMYHELENLERDYMKLFTGITLNRSHTYTFAYLPEKDTNTNTLKTVLCKFSPSAGIVDKTSNTGENILLQIQDKGQITPLIQHNKAKTKIQKGKHGFYYRMPVNADISIYQQNKEILTVKKLIAQLGVVLSLPNKKSSLTFDKKTGGINTISVY
ncbi:MAG: DUF4831 family protein [Bacteroidetes bacterium]|nr:DUF4831 family protein [Bacteroidota bacterium]